MPSVNSSSDGGYRYYNKSINDLEDELQKEKKRLEKRYEEKSQDLEEKYRANLEDRDRNTTETIQKIRDVANEAISKDRKNSKAEVDRMKADTYDKFGRYHGNEGDVLKQELDATLRQNEELRSKFKRDLEQSEKHNQESFNEERAAIARETEKSVREARDSANETYGTAFRGKAAEFSAFKDQANRNYQTLVRENDENLALASKATTKIINDARSDYEQMKEKLKDSLTARTKSLENTYTERAEANNRALAELHQDQTRALQQRLNEVLDAANAYPREKGQGTQEAIHAYDNEWRQKVKSLDEDFQIQHQRQKDQAESNEKYLSQANSRTIKEKELSFADQINKANQDNHKTRKDMEANFNRSVSETALQHKHEIEENQKGQNAQLDKLAEQREAALKTQAETYQRTIENNHRNDAQQVKDLERTILNSRTSSNPNIIPPAAEAALRKTVSQEYERTLNTEHERNQRALESMHKEYATRFSDALTEKTDSTSSIQRQNATERELERRGFLSQIFDTQQEKTEAIRNKDFENAKQAGNLNREYSSLLDKQRRNYDEVIQNLKNEATYKLVSERQENEFNSRMAQRDFTTKQNDLVREHERSLNEQKAEMQSQIEELKAQAQTAAREADRKSRQALDEQGRMYEQKIAQSEYQHKERERYMTENFQEQLQRIKIANGTSKSKKG